MEGQFISFYKNEVTLEIFLNDDLTSQGKDWASITVDTGMIGSKPKYWDNLRFFLENEEKVIKKQCKPDVKEIGLSWKEVYKDIKFLIGRAQKLGYL
jgi:hypothetical protein